MLLKSVILVDGSTNRAVYAHHGSRLTALEEVGNRPIVHHVLDALREVSMGEVIIAGEADALIDMRACLREYDPQLTELKYVVCQGEADISATFGAVAPLVGDAACIVQPADGLLDQPLGPLLELFEQGSVDLVLLARRQGADSGDGLPLDGGRDGPRAARATADVGVFAAGAFGRATEQLRCSGGADIAAAGKLLVANGGRVGLYPVEGWHRYRGRGRDLLRLNRIALDRLVGSIPPSARIGNRYEGTVLIDPTAVVRSSVITGPTVVGPGASVIDACLGPYTAIGANARIARVEIERSIVAPGASVMNIGARLVSSLVGRDARIYRDFSLPRALRLWVGSGDQVALC